MTLEEVITRLHTIEHKLDYIVEKLQLSQLGDMGDEKAAIAAKLPPTLPQEPRNCPVCNLAIKFTPMASYSMDSKGNYEQRWAVSRHCGCKIVPIN